MDDNTTDKVWFDSVPERSNIPNIHATSLEEMKKDIVSRVHEIVKDETDETRKSQILSLADKIESGEFSPDSMYFWMIGMVTHTFDNVNSQNQKENQSHNKEC